MGSSYKPAMVMIALELVYAGQALFSKAAFTGGLSPRVFIVYRLLISSLIMAPLAFFSKRNPTGASLTLESFSWIFAASLFGVTANHNAYFQGLNLASSTAANAIINLIPALTFVLAATFGMEKINIRSLKGGAKISGTVICVLGAMTMAFLKGPKLLNSQLLIGTEEDANNWLMGCVFLFACSFLWSLWIILLSTILALFVEQDFSAWKLNSFYELGCCLYTQAVALVVSFLGQSWCVGQRGPLFPAIFNPLCTVITAFFAVFFLHEQTYLGGLIGAVAVIMGLYVVLWGKSKDYEATEIGQKEKTSIVDLEEPFLPTIL
ncbi:WAT1-related protein At4g28040 [Linum grandiflorum]